MKASQFSVIEALASVFSISLLIGAIAGQIRLDVGWSVSKYLLDWTGVFDPGLLLFAGPISVPIFAILTVVGVYRIPVVRIFLSTTSLGSVATVLAVAFNQLGGIEVWSFVPFCCFFLTAIGLLTNLVVGQLRGSIGISYHLTGICCAGTAMYYVIAVLIYHAV